MCTDVSTKRTNYYSVTSWHCYRIIRTKPENYSLSIVIFPDNSCKTVVGNHTVFIDSPTNELYFPREFNKNNRTVWNIVLSVAKIVSRNFILSKWSRKTKTHAYNTRAITNLKVSCFPLFVLLICHLSSCLFASVCVHVLVCYSRQFWDGLGFPWIIKAEFFASPRSTIGQPTKNFSAHNVNIRKPRLWHKTSGVRILEIKIGGGYL